MKVKLSEEQIKKIFSNPAEAAAAKIKVSDPFGGDIVLKVVDGVNICNTLNIR